MPPAPTVPVGPLARRSLAAGRSGGPGLDGNGRGWWVAVPGDPPGDRFDRGLQAIAARDWKAAEEVAARLSASGHPDHAHILRAESLYARKDPAAALAECNQIRPTGGALHFRAATLSGKCLLELREPGEARRVFAFVVQEQPDNVDAHRGLAAATYDLGQTGQAMAHLEQVIRLAPDDYRPHRLLGNIHRDAGSWGLAEPEYRAALRLVGRGRGPRRDMLRPGRDPSPSGEVRGHPGGRGRGRGRRCGPVADGGPAGGSPPGARAGYRGRPPGRSGTGDPTAGARASASAVNSTSTAGTRPRRSPCSRRPPAGCAAPYQAHFLLAQAYTLAGRPADAATAAARARRSDSMSRRPPPSARRRRTSRGTRPFVTGSRRSSTAGGRRAGGHVAAGGRRRWARP